MSGTRLSKREKLQLLHRVVLHLNSLGAEVEWTPIVLRFVERWNTRKEAPFTVCPPWPHATPLHFRAFINILKLQPLLEFTCPCGAKTNDGLVRMEDSALRCTSCADRISREKKENKP